jgi:hypothetical protein
MWLVECPVRTRDSLWPFEGLENYMVITLSKIRVFQEKLNDWTELAQADFFQFSGMTSEKIFEEN